MATLHEHLFAAWPHGVGPSECLRLLAFDIADRLRSDSDPTVDYIAIALSGSAGDVDQAAICYLYDFSQGVCLPAQQGADTKHSGLWVGAYALAAAEVETYLRLRAEANLTTSGREQTAVVERIEIWHKSFSRSLVLLMADAALSADAQTALVGLLRQGRVVLSAAQAVRRALPMAESQIKPLMTSRDPVRGGGVAASQYLAVQVQTMRAALTEAQAKMTSAARGALQQASARLDAALRPAIFLWRPSRFVLPRRGMAAPVMTPAPQRAKSATVLASSAQAVAVRKGRSVSASKVSGPPMSGTSPMMAATPATIHIAAPQSPTVASQPALFPVTGAPSLRVTKIERLPPSHTSQQTSMPVANSVAEPRAIPSTIGAVLAARALPVTSPANPQDLKLTEPPAARGLAKASVMLKHGNQEQEAAGAGKISATPTAVETLYEAITGKAVNFRAAAEQTTCSDGHVGCNGTHAPTATAGSKEGGVLTVKTYAPSFGGETGFAIVEDDARKRKPDEGRDKPRRRARIEVPSRFAQPT